MFAAANSPGLHAVGQLRCNLISMHRFLPNSVALFVGTLVLGGCQHAAKKAEPAASPAKVDKVQAEADLNRIVLKPEAEDRLGISLASIEVKPISRVRTYGGE